MVLYFTLYLFIDVLFSVPCFCFHLRYSFDLVCSWRVNCFVNQYLCFHNEIYVLYMAFILNYSSFNIHITYGWYSNANINGWQNAAFIQNSQDTWITGCQLHSLGWLLYCDFLGVCMQKWLLFCSQNMPPQ